MEHRGRYRPSGRGGKIVLGLAALALLGGPSAAGRAAQGGTPALPRHRGGVRTMAATVTAGTRTQITVAAGLSGPRGVAVDGKGAVYIADASANRVVRTPAAMGTARGHAGMAINAGRGAGVATGQGMGPCGTRKPC